MRRCLVLFAALVVFGCKDECGSSRCDVLDARAEAGDLELQFDRALSMATFEVESHWTDLRVQAASAAMKVDDIDCIATPATPCTLTLRHLRIEIDSIHLDTTDGNLYLERPSIAVEAPLELTDRGFGFVIPAETSIQTCMMVDGRSDSARTPLATTVLVTLDGRSQGVAIQGVFPMRFRGGDDECTSFDGSVNVVLTGDLR